MIRLARNSDLDILSSMLQNARDFMHTHGNPNQWNGAYPNKVDLEEHILKKDLYVIEEDREIQFAFVFSVMEEPSYSYIEGSWINDEPYAVFHLVFSAMKKKHLGDQMINFGKERINNLRIDTHENNQSMKRLVMRNGFKYTGTIYVSDGTPRNAYQWCRNFNEN